QCRAGGYMSRYTIVVDEDIDPSNFEEVMWGVCTRTDPAQDIEILRRCWSGPLDPAIPFTPDGFKGFHSRAVIDACRPYEWREQFSPVVGCSPELIARMKEKWKERLEQIG
ncbi:MAG TPA: UbiD family decarboxylase, partial [bacterium]|nr:UbiD family decarboxylase [bacterium]